jgi:hypothetical protein
MAKQPFCGAPYGKNHGDTQQDHQQDCGITIADQLVGQEYRDRRQGRGGRKHPAPALAQGRRLALDLVDVAVGDRRGRGPDLLVQLGDQELAHLGIAEPRQQIAQRLPGQRLGQSGRRACCDLPGGGRGSLRLGLPGFARQT